MQEYFYTPEREGESHRIAYMQWGDIPAQKYAFCVHGLSRNSRDFDFLAKALVKESYTVICPDMPGRGKSEWLKNIILYDYPTYVRDCLSLMQHLGIESAHWVGTSMGGIIGMMMAAGFPALITKLVLNDIGSLIPKAGLERIVKYVSDSESFTTMEAAKHFMYDIFKPFGIEEKEHWEYMFEHSVITHPDGGFMLAYDPKIIENFRINTQNFSQIEDVDLSSIWNEVHCPTLLIRGKYSDLLLEETMHSMATQAHVEHITYDHCGHAPALFTNKRIYDVIEFLSKE